MTSAELPLEPLAYHHDVVAHLQAHEPDLWALFASATATDEFLGAVQATLLRSTYRLEPDAHPEVFEPAGRAAAALGLELPVTIYQAEGRAEPNAGLVFVPGELIFVLSGSLLALLDADELTAVFGHEIAHHRLWTHSGADFLTADRLLAAAADDEHAAPSHIETARRYALSTELFADRGAFIATGRLPVAVASLVKVATGLAHVSADAYLRQAEQVVTDGPGVSEGITHPENFIRTRALQQWSSGADTTAAWVLVDGALDIDHLDLLGQRRLDSITQTVIADLLRADWLRTDAVLGHAGQFSSGAATPPPGSFSAGDALDLAAPTRRYLAYVLADFATVDPDLDDEPLVEVFAHAVRLGLQDELAAIAATELKLKPAAVTALGRRGAERAAGMVAS